MNVQGLKRLDLRELQCQLVESTDAVNLNKVALMYYRAHPCAANDSKAFAAEAHITLHVIYIQAYLRELQSRGEVVSAA